uniref:Ig-like domain-containing protein n=1 Tax=Gouania willdenowi TaxID=441366 RepID=A0A8C5E7T0_GOUWI
MTNLSRIWGFIPLPEPLTLLVLSYTPPTLSVPQQWVVLERASHLTCHIDNFYPSPVSYSWTRDGVEVRPFHQVEGELNPEGYYSAVTNLTIFPSREDQNATFGCKVSHRGNLQQLDFKLNITCKWEKQYAPENFPYFQIQNLTGMVYTHLASIEWWKWISADSAVQKMKQ